MWRCLIGLPPGASRGGLGLGLHPPPTRALNLPSGRLCAATSRPTEVLPLPLPAARISSRRHGHHRGLIRPLTGFRPQQLPWR